VLWTLIVESSGRSGSDNMGIDYSLLHRAQEGCGFLRLYGWSPPCLSFGRNEPALRRYNVTEIHRLGLDTVRRPTGGRAVWHDAEVTYSVAAPASTFGTLRETYNIIHRTLAAALQNLGVPTELAGSRAAPTIGLGSGACFASSVGGEVVVRGRKLVGSAQVREGTAFLQHGSVLLEDGQDVVAQVTRGAKSYPMATSIASVLERPVTAAEVAGAIATEASHNWPGGWVTGDVPSASLAGQQFASPKWTWRR
jgi:lipoate-protein ligase A